MLPKQGYPPDIKKYYDKRLLLKLVGNRRVVGKVIGFDHFMNLTLDEAFEYQGQGQTQNRPLHKTMIRGCSVVFWQCLDKID